jgi:hypothetical protein
MAEVRATSAPEAVKTQLGQPIKTPPAPSTQRIYAKDGSFLDVFPVDAKEAVALGEYSFDPPVNTEPAAEEASESSPDFEAMTKAELQEYAEAHGLQVSAAMTKAEQIEAIQAGSK